MTPPFSSSVLPLPGRLRPSTLWRLAGAAASGFVLSAAFPPAGEWESAWVAFVPLILVARFTLPGRAFGWGWFSGLVFWLPALSWLLRLRVTGGPPVLVVLGWLLLAAYCAVYTGAFLAAASWLLRRLAGEHSPATGWGASWRRVGLLLLLPVVWVGAEYLRAILLTGFPWNALGISQYRNLSVVQCASWGGVYAVSAVVMVMNTALALTCLDLFRRAAGKRRRFRAELMVGLLLCMLCWVSGARSVAALRYESAAAEELRIAAVQPAVEQDEKWSELAAEDIFRGLAEQTRLALLARPQLVVWPETALPGPLPHDEQSGQFAAELAREGAPILAGAMEVSRTESAAQCWNSSFLYGTDGAVLDRYRKRHLVPFGEYIPLDRLITPLQKLAPLGVSCVPGRRCTLFSLPGSAARFATLICFEDVFPDLSRDAAAGGADLLINQTNDAWFDGSSGAVQHMAHAVFRCVENRRPMVRSANTGVTCHIDITGRASILSGPRGHSAFPGFAVYGVRVFPAGAAPRTPYTRWGDRLFAVPCLAATLGLAAWMVTAARKERGLLKQV